MSIFKVGDKVSIIPKYIHKKYRDGIHRTFEVTRIKDTPKGFYVQARNTNTSLNPVFIQCREINLKKEDVMYKFKVGDRVRCIKESEFSDIQTKVGYVYTVQEVNENGSIRLSERTFQKPERFEPVTQQPFEAVVFSRDNTVYVTVLRSAIYHEYLPEFYKFKTDYFELSVFNTSCEGSVELELHSGHLEIGAAIGTTSWEYESTEVAEASVAALVDCLNKWKENGFKPRVIQSAMKPVTPKFHLI